MSVPGQEEAEDVAMGEMLGGAPAFEELKELAQDIVAPAEEAPQPQLQQQGEEKKAPPRRNRGLRPAPKMRRLPGGGVVEVPEPAANEEAEDDAMTRMRKYPAKIRQLKQRATNLLEQVNVLPGDADAQALYAKYQETKQQLVAQIQKIVDLEHKVDEFQLNAEGNVFVNAQDLQEYQDDLDQDFQQLEQVVQTLEEQLQKQVNDARALRAQFGIQGDLQTQADFDNYYGVYFYNVLLTSCKQVVQTLNLVPPAVPGIYNSEGLFLTVIDNEVAQETTKQTTYLVSIERLQNNIRDKGLAEQYQQQLATWDVEVKAVNERLKIPDGTLRRCRDLALAALQQNAALRREAERQVAYWQPFEATEILQGVVGTRMFENDILPEQLPLTMEYGAGFNNLPLDKKQEFKTRALKDIAWRRTGIPDKQKYLLLASQWAEAAGNLQSAIEPDSPAEDVFGRLLEGVLSHLGLKIMKAGDLDLKRISQNWNTDEVRNAMRSACKSNDPQQAQQFVIRPQIWDETLEIMRGSKRQELLGQDTIFFVLLGPGDQFFGLLQTRNSQYVPDLKEILQTITVNPQGPSSDNVPKPLDDKSLEITFLCTQRANVPQYYLRNQPPSVGLGVLLMLYAFWWSFTKKYTSTMLEVVGTEGGSEEKKVRGPQDIQEGVSQGKANSSVAAFYQRQFKFQRTGGLENFSDEPALGYFHPNWNAYTLQKKRPTEAERLQQSQRSRPKPVLPVMIRPYPTLPDLADTLARLVRDVQKHYG